MLHTKHLEWIMARGLSPEIISELGLTSTEQGGKSWLTVPYIEHGKVVNHKYRLTLSKRHMMDTGSPLVLWNHDVLLSDEVRNGHPVIICEGEWDAIAAIQSGFHLSTSVPNGGPEKEHDGEISEENDAERYRFIWRSKALLDQVASFILAVDGDDVGRILAAELARRLGAERCKFVTYPACSADGAAKRGREVCKDLNEVLEDYGEGGVARVLNSAKPYPVKGLYRMSDFPDPPPLETYDLGVPGMDNPPMLTMGTLAVWTGFAGAGKTSLMVFVIANLLRRGIFIALGSFETMVKPILQTKLRATLLGCSDKDTTSGAFVDRARLAEADAMIEERLVIIAQDLRDEDHEITLEELLEDCRISAIRDGTRLFIIDPWNELEHKRRENESETEYTGRAIRALKAFARLYNVAVWIVAHPKKPMQWGQKPEAPGLYDVSGSAHWANKADYGFVVHRPNKEEPITQLAVTKVRMGMPGREQSVKLEWHWQYSNYLPAPGQGNEAA